MLNDHEQDFLDRWESLCDITLYHSTYHQQLPWSGTGRKFKADFVEPLGKSIIEIQGAVWTTGGHSTGAGITRDAFKALLALKAGWVTISIPTTAIDDFLTIAVEVVAARSRGPSC